MLNLEKMIGAMYDIIKSMLNIKPKQLRSDVSIYLQFSNEFNSGNRNN